MVNTKPIRVAQIIGMAIDGGVEAFAMNYYKNIDRNRVQFDFFVESTSRIIDKDKIESLGGKVVIVPHYTNVFRYIRKLIRLIKDGNYDIVHSNMNTLSVFSLYAAKKAGVKVRIAHSHSTSNKKEWKKNIIKKLLRPFSKTYATHYFACSELAGKWLFGNKSFESGKVTIIRNAIDPDRFQFNEETRRDMRKQLEIGNRICFGHVGRFMPQKNQIFLLKIFNALQKIHPNSILLMVGDGPLHQILIDKAKALGIYEKVVFTGVHKHPERYYQAMDIFLLPSLYEGLGMVLIEAQLSGLPCFTSSEVPKEARILDSTYYLDLELGAEAWAQEIAKKEESIFENREGDQTEKIGKDRANAYGRFKGSSYDIQSEAKKLVELYEKIAEREESIS
ncbi:MAG: glycosyltransferase family 1 protein [Candidatus Gallimonas sp.]